MDWTGQRLAEALTVYIITAFSVAGAAWGYAVQDFGATIKIFFAGVALASVAAIPDWPWLNRHPEAWLPADKGGGDGGGAGPAKRKAPRRLPAVDMTAASVLISKAETEWVAGGFAAGTRGDGRGRGSARSLELATGGLPQASGSAEVELEAPPTEAPDHGVVGVSVEISPVAGLQGRAGEDLAAELGQALERSLAPGPSGRGAALDLAALCVAPGAAAWHVRARGLVLAADGGLPLALSLGIRAALADTRIPRATVAAGGGEGPPEVEVDDDLGAATRVDASRAPALVTVAVAGGALAVDPTAVEEAAADALVTVAVDARGVVRGAASARGALAPAVLGAAVAAAARAAPGLLAAVGAVADPVAAA